MLEAALGTQVTPTSPERLLDEGIPAYQEGWIEDILHSGGSGLRSWSSTRPMGAPVGHELALIGGIVKMGLARWGDIFEPRTLADVSVYGPFAPTSISSAPQVASAETLDAPAFGEVRVRDIITPAAEQFGRTHGMSGALTVARDIVCRRVPYRLGLTIDVVADPEDRQLESLVLTVVTDESVDALLNVFAEIANELRTQVAPTHQERLTIDFAFR
jgi:hypothetical protein